MATAAAPATVNANQALWEKGDFTRIASTMRKSGDELVASLGELRGLRVLDLGSGDGTTAIPAARRGAIVTGIDIARNLVDAGNERAVALGLRDCRFEVGDASDLVGVKDGYFDLVVTIFGAMFAPRPVDVAREMVRVTRSGGRIVMGNWIPNDPTLVAQVLKISSAYTPPPPEGFISPMMWGVEASVTERFVAAGIPADRITFQRDTFTFRSARSPASLVATFRDYYGPTMNAFAAARAQGKEAQLQRELDELFERENRGTEGTEIPATYLRVTVQKP